MQILYSFGDRVVVFAFRPTFQLSVHGYRHLLDILISAVHDIVHPLTN